MGRQLLLLGLVGVLGAGLVVVGWAGAADMVAAIPASGGGLRIGSLLFAVAFIGPVVVLCKSLGALSKNESLWQMLRQDWRAAIKCGCLIACLCFAFQLVDALTRRGTPTFAAPWTLATIAGYISIVGRICGGIILLTLGVRALSLFLWGILGVASHVPAKTLATRRIFRHMGNASALAERPG